MHRATEGQVLHPKEDMRKYGCDEHNELYYVLQYCVWPARLKSSENLTTCVFQ